jgi:hypothetical protein
MLITLQELSPQSVGHMDDDDLFEVCCVDRHLCSVHASPREMREALLQEIELEHSQNNED